MENQKIIESIVYGMYYYLETLALPSHMENYDDGICAWIKPKDGAKGAACAYKVNLGDISSEKARQIIQSYREIGAPDEWFASPLSTPWNVRDILVDMKLTKPCPEDNAQGMAIPPERINYTLLKNRKDNPLISVKRVITKEDFGIWAGIINKEIFQYEIIDPELHYLLCESSKWVCFLGYYDGVPAAASTSINKDGNGMLEFIATSSEYRRKGLGTAVCYAALEQLVNEKASFITLRGTSTGVPLYRSLGFDTFVYF